MTITVAWVLALAPHIHDAKGFSKAMPREVADAITAEANSNPFAGTSEHTAITLVLWTFCESSWRTTAIGDGGRSCGLGQTRCAITPFDARGQIRLVAATMKRSMTACPEHPFAVYAGGVCGGRAAKVSDERAAAVKAVAAAVAKAGPS